MPMTPCPSYRRPRGSSARSELVHIHSAGTIHAARPRHDRDLRKLDSVWLRTATWQPLGLKAIKRDLRVGMPLPPGLCAERQLSGCGYRSHMTTSSPEADRNCVLAGGRSQQALRGRQATRGRHSAAGGDFQLHCVVWGEKTGNDCAERITIVFAFVRKARRHCTACG